MQMMGEQAQKLFPDFLANYREMMKIGEKFVTEKVLRTWQIGQFCRARDGASYFIYRYFPEMYSEIFEEEPLLPHVPLGHHLLHHVLYVPERLFNNYWWPRFGAQVEGYMRYYMERFTLVVERLESQHGLPRE